VLYLRFFRGLTQSEIAGEVGVSQMHVSRILSQTLAFLRGEVLGGEDPSLEILEGWASIAPAVKELPERERRVLYLRFFRGLTQSEIAGEVGVSQMHVSRILSQTLAFLRGAVLEEGDPLREVEPRGADLDDS